MERIANFRKMSTVLGALVLALGLVVTSAAAQEGMPGEQPPPQPPAAQEQTPTTDLPPELMATCPLLVPGTQVEVENTDSGVALSFTTQQADQVDALRTRVRSLADTYQQIRGRDIIWRSIPGAKAAEGEKPREAKGQFPAATANAEEIENGLRLTFVPTQENQLNMLRQHVRAHRQHMQAGQCFMVQPQQ